MQKPGKRNRPRTVLWPLTHFCRLEVEVNSRSEGHPGRTSCPITQSHTFMDSYLKWLNRQEQWHARKACKEVTLLHQKNMTSCSVHSAHFKWPIFSLNIRNSSPHQNWDESQKYVFNDVVYAKTINHSKSSKHQTNPKIVQQTDQRKSILAHTTYIVVCHYKQSGVEIQWAKFGCLIYIYTNVCLSTTV